jgi:hypothetical protein
MNRRLFRRVAIALIALLAFAQASVALAGCPMERGAMSAMLQTGEPCGTCETEFKPYFPEFANRCVAHCTADLQNAGSAVALVRSPGEPPLLVVLPAPEARSLDSGLEAPPPGAPPRRILLHSFLI